MEDVKFVSDGLYLITYMNGDSELLYTTRIVNRVKHIMRDKHIHLQRTTHNLIHENLELRKKLSIYETPNANPDRETQRSNQDKTEPSRAKAKALPRTRSRR